MDDALEFRLLNEFQRDFPLCPAPFAELAARLGVGERTVLTGIEKLRREGKISRVGAVFAPKRIGASTLAAMAVPAQQLEAVDRGSHRFELRRRNRHRGQRRGADPLGREDGADARDLALAAQLLKPGQNRSLADPEARRQFGEGRRTQRKIALEFVEQAKLEGVVHRQKPMRAARVVKKMPEGLSAAISPTRAKDVVS